ncbi:MAG TPA: M48 family metallopeptidase [Vicinamibacterales bacterium]|nr:M48 family metallopeptidase [Vicinamibacterales bacterium]
MHRLFIPSALAGVILLATAARAQISLISVDQEIQLGRQAQKEVSAKVPRVTDRAVVSYVQSVGRRLTARGGGPRYPYSFSIADYREINAFALPGGPVWIHRGAISAARNEAQLASVIAHEIAHIAQRHAADQLTKGLVANGVIGLLGAVLGNDRSARSAQIAAQVMANGYMLKFSRDDEREADRVGATIMRRAGWDAREMIAFMEILKQQQGRDPGSVEIFLSSHPAPGERAALLRSSLKGVSGGRRDSSEFQDIRARLKRLPPARSVPAR